MTSSRVSRRAFVSYAAISASALALGLVTRRASAAGESLPHLSDKDPMAKALHYTANAASVNKANNPSFKIGDRCAKCRFFQGKADEASGYAGCQLYPGYAVNAKGWCSSYNARA